MITQDAHPAQPSAPTRVVANETTHRLLQTVNDTTVTRARRRVNSTRGDAWTVHINGRPATLQELFWLLNLRSHRLFDWWPIPPAISDPQRAIVTPAGVRVLAAWNTPGIDDGPDVAA